MTHSYPTQPADARDRMRENAAKESNCTKAKDLAATLRRNWNIEFDDAGAIGKRYRRQDEIGTPFCVTVDFESLEDQAVTDERQGQGGQRQRQPTQAQRRQRHEETDERGDHDGDQRRHNTSCTCADRFSTQGWHRHLAS